jgi:hypothetical protein
MCRFLSIASGGTCELPPCGLKWRRKLVKLFRRAKSTFYWYDFTVHAPLPWVNSGNEVSQGLEGGEPETGLVMENTDPLPANPTPPADYEKFGNFGDRAATRCNLLDLNGTDSPFSILQETLWPAYWTQIGPRFGRTWKSSFFLL